MADLSSTTFERGRSAAGSGRCVSSWCATVPLEDGNHRVEGLRRADETEAWAVVAFDSAGDRDRFEVPAGS